MQAAAQRPDSSPADDAPVPQSGAARQRAYANRIRRGERLISLILTPAIIDQLVADGFLANAEFTTLDAVHRAICRKLERPLKIKSDASGDRRMSRRSL